jgi:DNA polymerase elongation subunit (family B)
MNKKLIYGKNELTRIVSIEIKDDTATIFRELEDGSIDVVSTPHKYWILSNKPHSKGWVRLQGEQHYKWGKQYTTIKEWLKDKKDTLKNADTYSIGNAAEAMMIKDGFGSFKEMQHTEVSILCFDIEATGLDHNNSAKSLLISNTLRKNGEITRKLFSYDEYTSDHEMIDAWANWVCENDPSIIAGHNIYSYDLPYLDYCRRKSAWIKEGKPLNEYGDPDYEQVQGIKIGRLGKELYFNNYESKFRVDGSRDLHYKKANIYGRQIVDTMFLAYRYDIGRKYDSYGLKYIIEKEGLTKENRVFYDASKIRDNYKIKEEWQKIKEYCMDDGDDALSVYDLMVPPFFYMAQMIPKPFQLIIESASGSQLNALLVRSYLQDKHSIPKADEKVEFEGAISFGEPGIYNNAVSLDIASLYPSVMLQYDVYSKDKDPNRHMLGFLEYMRGERLKNKKLAKETGEAKYKHLDGSYKILINSLYGFMGATGLNYNYPGGAAEVTRRGREILIQSIEWAKSKGYQIPKGDTDSITMWKNNTPFTEIEVNKLIDEINGMLPQEINFELDAFYDCIVVFKAKNYAYREGEKISTKGSAIKASTKSSALKEFIKKVLECLLYDASHNQISKIYQSYAAEIKQITDIKRWAARKTLSSTMQESERANETKVMDALQGSDYQEGDRFWVYYKLDDSLALVENFNGDYNYIRLYKNLYDTIKIFETVLPVKELCINYSLKRNLQLTENL